ncbi:MAG: hypothetical protein Q8P92_00045 [Candidatus Daviesbacteria bacterium]|nr:hypothetical protein [Candidatus Daviesbacteria bacterium]
MDGLPEQPISPQPPASSLTSSERSLPKNILKIVGVLLILGSVAAVLFYFKILPLPKRGAQPPTSTTQESSIKELAFVCPVEKELCSLGKKLTYRGNHSLVYNLASGSAVFAIANVAEAREFQGPDVKGVKHTFEFGDSCYSLTYTLIDDATIEPNQPQTLTKNTPVAKTGAKKMTVGDQTMNLILQMQSVPLSEIEETQGLPKCSSLNPDLRAKDFGKYLELDENLFK